MAIRRNKKVAMYSILSGVLVAILTSGVWFASYRYYHAKLVNERASFERQLAEKSKDLQRYKDESKKGYVLTSDIKAGSVLSEGDIREEKLPAYFTPANVIAKKEDLIGKIIKIDAAAGTSVTSAILRSAEALEPSTRKQETEYIKLPLRIQKRDVVDVRIVFPTGEDYIVVAKKTLADVEPKEQTAFFEVNEEELLLLQSALVDAYIHMGELYAIQYVEPEFQEKPKVTYIPTQAVLDAIQKDPAIVNKAAFAEAKQVRQEWDARLAKLAPSEKIRVGAGVPAGSGVGQRMKEIQGGATTIKPSPSKAPAATVRPGTGTPAQDSAASSPSLGTSPAAPKPASDGRSDGSDLLGG